MESKNKKSFNKRAVVSVALFILFILLPISGKMIEAEKDNPDAMFIWGGIHYLLGLLFTIFGLFHIVYNWKILTHYLKKR